MARPFRYSFIFGLVATGTVMAAVGGWRHAGASAPVSGPIIPVTVDALRADRLPLYDQSTIVLAGAHSEGLGSHREQAHGLPIDDDAVRAPLVVKLAAGEAAGRRVPALSPPPH